MLKTGLEAIMSEPGSLYVYVYVHVTNSAHWSSVFHCRWTNDLEFAVG